MPRNGSELRGKRVRFSRRPALAAGAEHEAGLLIMGAYSHSRLREMLLGGATRHILKNASAHPVL